MLLKHEVFIILNTWLFIYVILPTPDSPQWSGGLMPFEAMVHLFIFPDDFAISQHFSFEFL